MSITAILTFYKRPYCFLEQLKAVQEQSVKPEHIIIWKNTTPGIELPEIPPELNENVTVIDSSKNFGVWARFAVGLLATTEYICVFDDDTIPQSNWFLNCLNTMKVKPGLLGTIGVLLNEGVEYKCIRIGWDGPNEEIEQVDLVGHAWFFRQEWLSHLWQFNPDYSVMFKAGEDMAFSYCLQKAGINTYVPPHPKDDRTLWGSDPQKAMHYGCDINAAISREFGSGEIFSMILEDLIRNLGFETINNRKAKEEGRIPF